MNTRWALPILIGVGALTHLAHLRLARTTIVENSALVETLPSAEALRLISLGYPELTADYYWLRAIADYGDSRMHDVNYPNLAGLLERASALDPLFASVYIFAGTPLTTNNMDPNISVQILERGMEHRPDQWKIPFLLGFNSYYFLSDFPRAADALAVAAENPEAPIFVPPLAARVATEAGEPEAALQLLDAILQTVSDPKLRERYEERRREVLTEYHLKHLNLALGAFEKRYGRGAASLEELVEGRMLRGVPEDPSGGRFFVDETGRVTTTAESRLRKLPTHQGGRPR